jgi:AcrR family transcriptional regulator
VKTSRPRSNYHHGDLRAALLSAARALLDEGGVPAVSLRDAARRAGVTPGACYRHFTDKEALLTALAVQGFEEFAQALGPAAVRGQPKTFAEMGVAYVAFAVQRPGLFRLMFGPAVADRSRSPELMQAIETSTQRFEGGLRSHTPDGSADPVAGLRAWAMVHGLATLAIDGMLPGYDPVVLAQALAKMPPKGAPAGRSSAPPKKP